MTSPSRPVLLLAPGSVLSTANGVAATADAWSGELVGLDAYDLAYAVFEASLLRPGPLPDRVETRRAWLLMLARRYDDALAALPAGVALPGPEGAVDRDQVVLATCRAAAGDDEALAALIGVASAVAGSDWAGVLAHCLLRVGDARGRADLTAAALGQLQRLDDHGREVVPRLVADLVGRRSSRPTPRPYRPWGSAKDSVSEQASAESATLLRAATDLLHAATASFVSDPQPVLDAATELRRRDDPVGAALLLNAVDRTNPDVGRVRAALSAYGDPRHRRRRGLVFGGAAAAVLVSGPLGLPIIGVAALLAVLASEVLLTAPGLDRFESGVVDTYVRQLRKKAPVRLVASLADEPVRGRRRANLMVVVGLLALVAGIVAFPHALAAARAHGPSATSSGAGLLCVLVWILGLPTLALWAAALVPLRVRYVVPALTWPEADCQCEKGNRAAGRFAAAYAAAHLVVAETPAVLGPALASSTWRPGIRRCPDTGAAWLVLTTGPEKGKILIRGPIGRFPDPTAAGFEPPTGQYL